MLKPLPLNPVLAGNPNRDPQWNVRVRDLACADPKATRALVALMDMAAVMGGAASHYGGPAAFAELMSALHALVFHEAQSQNQPWHQRFNLVNDAGHCENGLYALKANYGFAGLTVESLKKFRSIESFLTGHGESHLFPQGVQLSNGPLGSALPQAQGLALADALAATERVTVTAISDGACMEGEAREAFAAIPGLARRGLLAPFVMIISDNNTKLSGRIDKDSFSMEPTFSSLGALGWKVLHIEDGHDLAKCVETLTLAIQEARQNSKIPIAVHAKTIKGIGTKKTAESASGGHGFPLKSPTELPAFLHEIYEGGPIPPVMQTWIDEMIQAEKNAKASAGATEKTEKIQVGVAQAMIKARQQGLPVLSITSDLAGSTGVAAFRKEFPLASVDVGVAESNMISTAAGCSKLGFIPVVDTFAQFGVTKGALPLTMASLSDAPLIAIFSHTGFQDAADGASHQALSYLAMMSSIPHCDVYALTCTEEAEALVGQAIAEFAQARQGGRVPRTSIFFLGRENFRLNYQQNAVYKLGQAQIVGDNTGEFAKSVCLVASGSLLPQALIAAKELAVQKIGTIVINPSIHNRPDLNTLKSALQRTQHNLIVVEDHQAIGGLGHLVAGTLLQAGVQVRARLLGVQEQFGQSAYNAIDLYRKHGLDSGAISRAAVALLSNSN